MSGPDVPPEAAAGGTGRTSDPTTPATPAVERLSFDAALAELQRAVATLEEGGLPLERTLELYERGAALHARCATLLDEAELRIRRLRDGPDGVPTLVDEPGDGGGSTGPHDGAVEESAR